MAEQTLRVLVAQGEEIINDLIEATSDNKHPKTHWKEVESWQTRARQYISNFAPEFLDRAEMLTPNADLRHEVYPKLRSALSILTEGAPRIPRRHPSHFTDPNCRANRPVR